MDIFWTTPRICKTTIFTWRRDWRPSRISLTGSTQRCRVKSNKSTETLRNIHEERKKTALNVKCLLDEWEDPKVKDTCKQDSVSPKAQDSVFYAKEGKKKRKAEPLIQSGADGDVFKAQTPNQETQGAPEVKEAPDVHVELPVDRRPAEIVKDAEETDRHTSDFESNREDSSRMSFKKKFPLRHNTKKKASLKNLSKNKKVVPFPEKEPNDILEDKNTPVRPDTPVEEDQREPPVGQQSQGSSPGQPDVGQQSQGSSPGQPDVGQQSQGSSPGQPDVGQQSQGSSPGQPDVGQQSQGSSPGQPDVNLDKQESAEQWSLGQPSQEQVPDKQEPPEPSSLGQPSQEQLTQGDDKEQQIP
ncbi:doublecortin domain-containing protein 2C isoform X2 [Odocoileus virginianus]|uniref:Doublecortin domain-containing protein 2C isoform X2 n=1 Tax=Odocoileus virginianus TaxID=9874 RepID=A0ABM4HI86_ODOVR